MTGGRRQPEAVPLASGPGALVPGLLLVLATLWLWLTATPVAAQTPPPGFHDPTPPVEDWHAWVTEGKARVGAIVGTVHGLYAEARFPEASVGLFNNTSDLVTALKTGKVDVLLLDAITARAVLARHPDLARLAEGFLGYPLGVGFRPDRAALRARFDAFLARIRADGRHAEMHARWFQGDPERTAMPDIAPAESKERYVVGVSIGDLPYVEFRDGRYVGFDIELLQRFAAEEGVRLELVSLDFGALIPALASGKVDLISDGIAITEERRKRVDFSAPYAEGNSAALVLKSRLEPASRPSAQGAGALAGLRESLHANFLAEQRWRLLAEGILATLVISIGATLFGTLLGALVCAGRMARNAYARRLASAYITLLRGIPVLVLLMLVFYVAFANVGIHAWLVAVLAFGLNFAAYVSEIFRSGLESVPPTQSEAGTALGFGRPQNFLFIVAPQAIRRILPVYRGEFISLVKMTSVVGYIGVQDLTKAGDIIRSRTFEAFFPLLMVAAFYFLVVWLLGLALDWVERRTDPLRRRRVALGGRNAAGAG